MYLQQEKTTINGNEYELILFGCERSLGFVTKISSMIQGGITGEEMSIASVLLSAMSDDGVVKLIKDLVSQATFNGTKINSFDDHFGEHRKDLLPLVSFSISENVLPFIDPVALGEMMERLATSITDYLPE